LTREISDCCTSNTKRLEMVQRTVASAHGKIRQLEDQQTALTADVSEQLRTQTALKTDFENFEVTISDRLNSLDTTVHGPNGHSTKLSDHDTQLNSHDTTLHGSGGHGHRLSSLETAVADIGSGGGGGSGVPDGTIVMWHGAIPTIPVGWFLCDGSNQTPDLRDRFVVGSGTPAIPAVPEVPEISTTQHFGGGCACCGCPMCPARNVWGCVPNSRTVITQHFVPGKPEVPPPNPPHTTRNANVDGSTNTCGGNSRCQEPLKGTYALAFIMKGFD
jgi:hypothetical protein